MGTVLDSLTALATPAVGQLAEQLGESPTAVSRGLRASFTSVLAGLINKTHDTSELNPIFDLVSTRAADEHIAGEVQHMVDTVPAGVPGSGPAATLLKALFGDRVASVANVITSHAEFVHPKSGGSVLAFAAPLAFGFIGKQVKDGGMNVGGLTKLLLNERESVLASAPRGLSSVVDTGGLLSGLSTARSAATQAGAGGRGWLWPAATVAVLVLAWFAFTRSRTPAPATVTQAGEAVVKAAGGEVTKLQMPVGSVESKLVAFIEDATQPVNDTTWFDFDRINFETGSATLLPESQAQVDNIVAVLDAYPNVRVKVGGYTDNVGDETANQKLSDQRASAVKLALIEKGIAAERLESEGYGSQHPIASNATPDGRAKNRRISLKVTRK